MSIKKSNQFHQDKVSILMVVSRKKTNMDHNAMMNQG